MKKTLTTNGGQEVTFYKENCTIYAMCGNEEPAKVGFVYFDEGSRFEISDYSDEFDIYVGSDKSLEEAFDGFCEAFIGQLNVREVKRKNFIEQLTKELEAFNETSIVLCNGSAFKNICGLVDKFEDDADF